MTVPDPALASPPSNAPAVAQAPRLDDKYLKDEGRVLISGVQALIKLCLVQRDRDAAAGLQTAGFVTGYRGSPLGGLDTEFVAAARRIDMTGIRFEPGLNEDLAATAVAGSQQIDLFTPTQDGVFALWYAKGPGVDRAGDAIKHGNYGGTAPRGGVLVAFGDDHPGKSSSVAHQSEQALAAHAVPILYPSSVEEIVSFGLLGWAMSRYSGLWVGLKLVNETAETLATARLPNNGNPILPTDDGSPPEGVHHRGKFDPALDDILINRYKLPRAKAFARLNNLDRVVMTSDRHELGIVTAGKSYADTLRALDLLGIDAVRAKELGITLFKVGMVWPLVEESLTDAVGTCREILVIEEKRPILEDQIARALFNASTRPTLIGKKTEDGRTLLPSDVQLNPVVIAHAIAARLQGLGRADARIETLAARLAESKGETEAVAIPKRIPYFCSGCPHSSSTKVPDGSVALSGIGCHTMAIWMDRRTMPPTQMGGEGANWIGASPFVKESHVFQNLGDGTFTHSGLLAIRAAVVARSNITYKILHNDAVAMTGGQPVEGAFGVDDIARQVQAEGVVRCVVVTDDLVQFRERALPAGVSLHHRSEMESVQRALRATPGVTVLIFSQTCAAEKRRRRKKGLIETEDRRVMINPAVCENCGDCTVKSNCVSVIPIETDLGRKRAIDQSSCNQDFTCREGFCPSFVTVSGGLRRRQVLPRDVAAALGANDFPAPPIASPDTGILVAGIGGTGVITIGAVVAMAAHIEGKRASTYNMTGLAQKGGAVYSHIRITRSEEDPRTPVLGAADVDLLLGCDPVAAAADDALARIDQDRTHVVLNKHLVPTAAFQRDTDIFESAAPLEAHIAGRLVREDQLATVDATRIATAMLGDSIAANMFLVGYACQLGRLPVNPVSIERALAINAVSVDFNISAFRLGRLAAQRPELLRSATVEPVAAEPSFDELVGDRAARLVQYQDAQYSRAYREFVAKVAAIEDVRFEGRRDVSKVVARYLYKLMAYKDEYEVARLHSDPAFRNLVDDQFGGKVALTYHFAPPILAKRDPASGERKKRAFGPWLTPWLRLLASGRRLRGTWFDPFGYQAERREERRLIADYRAVVIDALERATPGHYAALVRLVGYPEYIRGYGHVKTASLPRAYRSRDAALRELETAKLSG